MKLLVLPCGQTYLSFGLYPFTAKNLYSDSRRAHILLAKATFNIDVHVGFLGVDEIIIVVSFVSRYVDTTFVVPHRIEWLLCNV